MTEVAVDPQIIKSTQDSLGKFVSNPTLTNKLLNKPPFKFLHDVINAVIKSTGFLDGLYSDTELSKDQIKDKEAKISFLQKCIDATALATGEAITVRASKIVSGHEADKTNELLQAIARAVETKVESKEAVEKVLSGKKSSKSKSTKDKSSKPSDSSKDEPPKVNGDHKEDILNNGQPEMHEVSFEIISQIGKAPSPAIAVEEQNTAVDDEESKTAFAVEDPKSAVAIEDSKLISANDDEENSIKNEQVAQPVENESLTVELEQTPFVPEKDDGDLITNNISNNENSETAIDELKGDENVIDQSNFETSANENIQNETMELEHSPPIDAKRAEKVPPKERVDRKSISKSPEKKISRERVSVTREKGNRVQKPIDSKEKTPKARSKPRDSSEKTSRTRTKTNTTSLERKPSLNREKKQRPEVKRPEKVEKAKDTKNVKRNSVRDNPYAKANGVKESRLQSRSREDKARAPRSRDSKTEKVAKPEERRRASKPSREREKKDKDPKRRESKSKEDGSRKPSRAGKENAPPPSAPDVDADAPGDVEIPQNEDPPEEIQDDVPRFNGDQEEEIDENTPDVKDGDVGLPLSKNSEIVDSVFPNSDATNEIDKDESNDIFDDNENNGLSEETKVPQEDLGIGSPGPGSLTNGQSIQGFDENDPAILKAMDPQGELQNLGADPVPNGEGLIPAPLQVLDNPDSGMGSIDSPKSKDPSPSVSPPLPTNDNIPAQNEATVPSRAQSSMKRNKGGSGPMRGVHNESAASESLVQSQPTRPPTSQGYASSRPVTARNARPRTARPPSARPAAPRVRDRKEPEPQETDRPLTSKTGAGLTALIIENNNNSKAVVQSSDGSDLTGADDEFLVAQSQSTIINDDPLGLTANFNLEQDIGLKALGGEGEELQEGEGGILIDKIMDVKKNLEDGRQSAFSPETPGHRRVNLDDGLNEAHRKKERELIQQDVNKLAGSIQTLTKAVNPLAKMLDYLQEDLDSMQKELDHWRDENKQLRRTLKSEQSNMTSSIKPLEVQLQELTTAIEEQQDKISIVKCSTLRNSARIDTLLTAVSLSND